ncbi:alpha/beta hydrolase [Pseudolysinimonas sp.]|uniref:RBBP9/YdeN family alpha/beta hydrolase n=1 Tax=Pseudolysinimonas sp. TaxID=2680009 RepID=UPI00286C6A03|nr:alpha/beta hydrolase [Pseudolysinimonas sp.]
MQSRFVILHGWENRRPTDHWQHWLFDQLSAQGRDVDYPQLPDPDAPDLATWLDLLDGLVTRGERPVTLIAHSLAASLWLTHRARGGSPGLVSRLALVAIPSPAVLRPTVVAPFVEHPPSIAALPGVEQIVFDGEGDSYSPGGVHADYAIDAAIPVEPVPGGGHLTPDSGFGPWPRILEWTLADPEVPS